MCSGKRGYHYKKVNNKEIHYLRHTCSPKCKPLTEDEVDSILSFKQAFDNPIDEDIQTLYECDTGCPNTHHYHMFRPNGSTELVGKQGHPLSCYSDHTGCKSKLRILRCGSFHYPVLLQFLKNVYLALNDHQRIKLIDTALGRCDFNELMDLTDTNEHCDLVSGEIETSYVRSLSGSESTLSKLRQPNLKSQIMIEHATVIDSLEKRTEAFAEHVCVSCERLCQIKNVSCIELSEDVINVEVWLRLLAYVIYTNPEASSEQLYICNYCKPRIRSNELPCRCVLNGLQTVPVPSELTKLDALSAQLIQRAKCYQTIVRLGTYG